MQHFKPNQQYTKTYKTYDRAAKAAEDLLVKFEESLEEMNLFVKFVIVAVPQDSGEVRYTPVFTGTQSATIWFVQENFCVVG